MGRIVVYTAVISDYDRLYEPFFRTDGVDMVCFTDQKGLTSSAWNVVQMKRTLDDPTREARRLKILPHRLFPDADATVWVDANLELLKVPGRWDVEAMLGRFPLAVYAHDKRKCLYDEAMVCKAQRRDDARVMSYQMARYAKEGMPRGFGLASTGFLARKNKPEATVFCEAWWYELANGSKRDQLSFDYCRWKLNFEVVWLDGSIYDGRRVLHRSHRR